MKTILFGAGASVDESMNGKVPLTSELFQVLRREKESWKTLDAEQVSIFEHHDFEDAMQLLLDALPDVAEKENNCCRIDFARLSNNPNLRLWSDLQWDMAEYFLFGHRLKECSLYIDLLEKIKFHFSDFKLSTLNYDILLFQALERVKLVSPDMNLATPIPICVPHGSSLLYCHSPNYKRTKDGYGIYPGQISGNPIHINENYNQVDVRVFQSFNHFKERRLDLFPPIMCYIEPQKRVHIGYKFIQAEQRKWREWVKHSTAIVIIGVSVNRNDKHIWGPLAQTSARILYVSGSTSKERFVAWCRENNRENDQATDRHWQDSQEEIMKFLEVES